MSKYVYFQLEDNSSAKCPDGSTEIPILNSKGRFCRSDCSSGDCKGYPGVSLGKPDGSAPEGALQLHVASDGGGYYLKGYNPWFSACGANSAGCCVNLYNQGDGSLITGTPANNANCCTGSGSCNPLDGSGGKIKSTGATTISSIHYKAPDCGTVCKAGEDNCFRRMDVGCGAKPGSGWSCDATQGCINDGGKYPDEPTCRAACSVKPSGNSWSCVNGSCTNVGAGNGDYSDSSCGGACGGGGGGGSSAIVIILSVVAGVILLAIIGMFVYLYFAGRKKKGGSPAFR